MKANRHRKRRARLISRAAERAKHPLETFTNLTTVGLFAACGFQIKARYQTLSFFRLTEKSLVSVGVA
jgi:outer membrane lipopolysaccharide assembly protein LptE/RlpB